MVIQKTTRAEEGSGAWAKDAVWSQVEWAGIGLGWDALGWGGLGWGGLGWDGLGWGQAPAWLQRKYLAPRF